MAHIKFEIDSEAHDLKDKTAPVRAAAAKVGLLSSIDLTLTPDLIAAFERGAGQTNTEIVKTGYKKTDIVTGSSGLKNKYTVLATVGGAVMLDAVKGDVTMPPFVSLVGSFPTSGINSCRGGVSLQSYGLNQKRLQYLLSFAGAVHTPATIYLLTNSNSLMHPDEQAAWASSGANAGNFLESYVGIGGNDASGFAKDFFGAPGGGPIPVPSPPKIPPAGATAVIISDDPYFQAYRGELIKQANIWLAASAQRHVVYPSQIYASGTAIDGSPQTPRVGQSTLFGPDLKSAYQLLGILAYRLVQDSSLTFGFVSPPSITNPL